MTDYANQLTGKEMEQGSINFTFGNEKPSLHSTLVIGVGGGGINVVSHMIESGVSGVEFAIIDTDKIMLDDAKISARLLIGQKETGGCGTGGIPSLGESCAEADAENIRQLLSGIKVVFLVAGFGGGTGTGAAPVVARIAREMGVLAIAFVTTPFAFEGNVKAKQAKTGCDRLRENIDCFMVIPNERMMKACDKSMGVNEFLGILDDAVGQFVQGFSELAAATSDFESVCCITRNQGEIFFDIGVGIGENRAEDAVKEAMINPFLRISSTENASKILIFVKGDESLSDAEIKSICECVKSATSPSALIFLCKATDASMNGKVSVMVVATAFET